MGGVQITDDCRNAFRTGGSTVGAAAAQLSATSVPCTGGVQIRAADANSGQVFVGTTAGVTADQTATGGYPLDAGESVFVPINDLAKVWLIATAAGQGYNFLAI